MHAAPFGLWRLCSAAPSNTGLPAKATNSGMIDCPLREDHSLLRMDEYQASSGIAVEGANGYGFVTGHGFSRAAKALPFPRRGFSPCKTVRFREQRWQGLKPVSDVVCNRHG